MEKAFELQGELSGHNKFTGIKREKKSRFVELFCVRKNLCSTGEGNVGKNIVQGSECHPASRKKEYKISALKSADTQESQMKVLRINIRRLNRKES